MPDGIGLISGGLDSLVAVQLLKNQGLDILGIVIDTGFTTTVRDRIVPREDRRRQDIFKTAEKMKFDLEVVDIREAYKEIVFNPRFGFGKNVNPCLDCRIMMLQTASRIMNEYGAQFVFTGEVAGQRPKSQLFHQLKRSEAESGLEGRLLRPLSAKLLPPTIPEQNGLVDRDQLEAISGRGRKRQIEIARQYGFEELGVSGGGNCFLIDRGYALRMRDLFRYKGKANIIQRDIDLLQLGRHFRMNDKVKLIISRNAREHEKLLAMKSGSLYLELSEGIGAIGLIEGIPDDATIQRCAEILGRYSKERDNESILFDLKLNGELQNTFSAVPVRDMDELHSDLL